MARITRLSLIRAKTERRKTVWLTASDWSTAQMADAAGVDVLLVGDSLGMVSLGFDSTLHVSLDEMIHHTKAVVRGRERAWVVCDLPFGSYQSSPRQACRTATRVLQETGCDAVKLEGGTPMEETVAFLSDRGIPVVGHIGLLPQSIKQLGSYRRQGKTSEDQERIMRDAKALEAAGAVSVVMECIPERLAEEITSFLSIPTVGIGSGPHCDAQVLVWHDLLGISERNPPFAPAYLNLREQIKETINRWGEDVRHGAFPHSIHDPD